MNGDELQGAVVLIVDDQPENLGVLFDYFHQFGCTVLICESGEDALEISPKNRPDIILLDILMPGIGGFETCRRLKADKHTQEIPVLFISSLAETVDKVKAFELGGVDFITKPFQTEEVLARVSAHLGYHKLKQELKQKNRLLEEKIRQHQVTEHALQKARDAANSANRTKSVFLTNMSHELRTPLNGILGYAQILLNDDSLSHSQQEALNTILQSGEHLLGLIEEILEFSKIETQRIELVPQCFHLPELLHSVADTARMLAFRKKLKFTTHIASDLPLIAYADRKRIRQILLNILSNAVKFTERGSIEFYATAKRWSDQALEQRQKFSLHLEIRDSGIGIPEHLLPAIFEPFKTSGAQYIQSEGAGLGLAVSRHLARMMGGEIFVESIEEQGVSVYVDLDLFESLSEETLSQLKNESDTETDCKSGPDRDIAVSGTPLVLPDADDLASLQEAVTLGDIMAIRRWVQQMKTGDKRLFPFVERIDRWAQRFDIGGLQEFLQESKARGSGVVEFWRDRQLLNSSELYPPTTNSSDRHQPRFAHLSVFCCAGKR